MPPWCSPDVDRTRLPRAGDGASCFLLLWLVTLPFTLISTFAWWSTPMVSIVAFLFFNLEQMAMEIEVKWVAAFDWTPRSRTCLGQV